MYLCHAILLFFAVFFPSSTLLFIVCNVERFLTSGYLDKKFIVLRHAFLPSKTSWENVISVGSDYSQFLLQPLRLGGDINRGIKRLPGRIILRIISCVHILTHLIFFEEKTYLAVLIY